MIYMYIVKTSLDSTTYLKTEKPDLKITEADIVLRRTMGFTENTAQVSVLAIKKTQSPFSQTYDQILSIPAVTKDGIKYYHKPGLTKRVIVVTPPENDKTQTVYNVDLPSEILKNNDPDDAKAFLKYVVEDFNRLHPDQAVENPAWYKAIHLPASPLKLYGVEVEEMTTNLILYQTEPDTTKTED